MEVITQEIIKSFVNCQYKAYLKFHRQVETKTEYECLDIELTEQYKTLFYQNLQSTNKRILPNIESAKKDQIKETSYVVNPLFHSSKYSIRFDAIEIFPHKKLSKVLAYYPIDIIASEKVTKTARLILTVKINILSQLQGGLLLEFGRIIYGKNLKTTKINFADYVKDAKQVTRKLTKTVNSCEPPPFYQDSHCRICEFQKTCRAMLTEKDDLSLLRGMSQKEIIKKKNLGIFTVLQFSYTFRPRKKKRPTPQPSRIEWALKALALREKKTYVQEIPKFHDAETEVFLDFEGLPDENIVYLIGLIVSENHTEKKYSFWADSEKDEEKIFSQLFEILSSLKNSIIYHYGNYEILCLKRFNKKSNNRYEEELNFILKHSVNILSFLALNVYPPTYTNELKDIAQFLGFRWSEKNASGIQSIVWRKRWELSQDTLYKRKLIQYNLEDCHALRLTKEWLTRIEETFSEKDINGDFIKVEHVKVDNIYKFGQPEYLIPEFKEITKYAYFDYQREKIYFKTNLTIKKALKHKAKKHKIADKVNKTFQVGDTEYPKCPYCQSEHLRCRKKYKMLIDLKFSNNGIRKWVTQLEAKKFVCNTCKKSFSPYNFKPILKYRHNLVSWVMNQHLSYRTSFGNIRTMLSESFNIQLSGGGVIYGFQKRLADEYRETFEEIQQSIISGTLLQIDETRIQVKNPFTGYVWIFASIDAVFYIFRRTREADFLKQLLTKFTGVLVSDFYPGYDSLPCPQQKCLIHLIRDLNSELFRNQLDTEFKVLASSFGKLLRNIVETINIYGLKVRHLNKHRVDVEKFYANVIDIEYESELAIQYQMRFQKNREKLFTFLQYDGIPWNNNNAEHAIKPFAAYRKIVDGLVNENGMNDYLILFSIQQTCKYRGLSFLEFLKSGEKSIITYSGKI
jgi:predicted RecB family nuclease